jgi:hypothetical protein
VRSGFERTLDTQLKKSGVDYDYEKLVLPFITERTYTPDFVLKRSGIIIEAKGKLDQDTRSKMLAVKKAHPHLDIRFVFMRASNKLSKSSKQTYAHWAEKNGFPWADGVIPQEWLDE